jgi:hypothetical protein
MKLRPELEEKFTVNKFCFRFIHVQMNVTTELHDDDDPLLPSTVREQGQAQTRRHVTP